MRPITNAAFTLVALFVFAPAFAAKAPKLLPETVDARFLGLTPKSLRSKRLSAKPINLPNIDTPPELTNSSSEIADIYSEDLKHPLFTFALFNFTAGRLSRTAALAKNVRDKAVRKSVYEACIAAWGLPSWRAAFLDSEGGTKAVAFLWNKKGRDHVLNYEFLSRDNVYVTASVEVTGFSSALRPEPLPESELRNLLDALGLAGDRKNE